MSQIWMKWRIFWALWLTGLALLIFLVASNAYLVTPVAPLGIMNHQSAATAVRVNAIHASWNEAGVNWFATASMFIDLLFIGLFSLGGIVGASLIRRGARQKALQLFGGFAALLYAAFGILDYVETIFELIQQISGQGTDSLALIAAAVGPFKMWAALGASLCFLVALVWYRLARLRKAAASESI